MSPLPPITTIFMFQSPVLPIAGAQKSLLALLGRKHCRNTLFFHQEHDELRRFAVARVAADNVNVIRAFIESFAGFERHGLGALQLHHDRTLEHVDEGVRIVPMDFVSAARRVGDRKYETFFAGNVRQGFGHDFLYVGRWSGRRELRGERTSSDCEGQDDLFHSDSSDLLFFQSLTATHTTRGTRSPVGIRPNAPAEARRATTVRMQTKCPTRRCLQPDGCATRSVSRFFVMCMGWV